jgi:hypothetical protein
MELKALIYPLGQQELRSHGRMRLDINMPFLSSSERKYVPWAALAASH